MGWGLFHIQAKEEAAKFSPKGCLPASQRCKGVGEGLPAPAVGLGAAGSEAPGYVCIWPLPGRDTRVGAVVHKRKQKQKELMMRGYWG